jgi:hypothetical protein
MIFIRIRCSTVGTLFFTPGAAFLAVPVPTGAPSTVQPCIKIGHEIFRTALSLIVLVRLSLELV